MGKLVSVAAPIVGGMVGGPVGAAIGSAVGGAVAGREAGKAAEAAANTSAAAQMAAANLAAEEARFRPVGITTRFGQSQFGFDDQGRLTSAGYTVSPELQALQSRLLGVAPGSLETALGAGAELGAIRGAVPGLFNIAGQFLPSSAQATPNEAALAYASQLSRYGQQFLPDQVSMQASPEAMAQAQGLFNLQRQITPTSYDPTAAAQSYFAEQQAMLDPVRQREEQRLASSVFGRGRAGLSVGDMGQPELFSLAQARGQQDLALAAQARERARQELQQDIGLGSNLGLQGLGTLQQAQEIARQRGIQDIGIGLDLSGRGVSASEAATDLARQRLAQDIQLGTGLFGTGASLLGLIPQYQTQAMAPFQTQLGLAQTIENLGQQPLDIGAQLGGRTATAGAQVGESLLAGGLGAAKTNLLGDVMSSSSRYGALQDLLKNKDLQAGLSGLFNRPTVASLGGTTGSQGFSYYGQ